MTGNGHRPAGGDAELFRLLKVAEELAVLFQPVDRAGLARLTSAEREIQLHARVAISSY